MGYRKAGSIRTTVATMLLLLGFSSAVCAEPEIAMNDENLVGKSRLNYMFWDVYDATLYATNGNWSEDKPFVLKLSYLRDLDGEDIAERSIDEMRKQGVEDEEKLATWEDTMMKLFPDVEEGDSLTGEVTADGYTTFYFNGETVDTIEDKAFTRAFFNIWLSEKTSEPEMRNELLGEQE